MATNSDNGNDGHGTADPIGTAPSMANSMNAADSNATHTDKSDTASESAESDDEITSLWRQHDYRAWFAADTSLMIGSLIGALAFDLLGYTISHDTAVAGLAATTYALARGAATLAGGWLTDHADRKKLMVAGGLTSFAVLASFVAAWLLGLVNVAGLFIFAVARGLTSGTFSSVTDAALPQIVKGNQLPKAFATNQTRDAIGGILASPLSGLLYALGPEIPFAFSAVMMLAMACAAPFITTDLHPGNTTSDTSSNTASGTGNQPNTAHGRSLTAGFRWFARWPQALLLLTLALLVNFALSIGSTVAILQQQVLGTPTWLIGLMGAASGASMIAGSLFSDPLSKHFTGGRIVQLSLLPTVIGYAAITFTDNIWATIVGFATASALLIPCNAVLGAYTMLLIPNDLRGRVDSIDTLCSMVLGSLASACAGTLLKYTGYRFAMATALAAIIVAVAMCLVSKTMRDIPSQSRFSEVRPLPLD